MKLPSEFEARTLEWMGSLRKRPFGRNVSLSAGVGYKF